MQEKVCKSKLIDAFIASLLRIPHAIVCVNKMDLVDFDEKVYDNIVSEFKAFSSKLDINIFNLFLFQHWMETTLLIVQQIWNGMKVAP